MRSLGSHPYYFLRTNERNKMTKVLLRSPGDCVKAARMVCGVVVSSCFCGSRIFAGLFWLRSGAGNFWKNSGLQFSDCRLSRMA